jgi:two-component system, cell cycle sensor histidine kinase and response regulator CckA
MTALGLPQTSSHPAARSIKVLLVEDNAGDARLVAELLREGGQESVALTRTDRLGDAIHLMEGEQFDAILIDLNLPDSDGLATFARARAAAPDLPFVVLTGMHDEETGVQAVREGAQDYLVKGLVEGSRLYHSIRYAVERHRFEEELRMTEARYRGLVEGSIQGILIHVDGTIRLANPALARLLGYSDNEELTGSSFWWSVHPEDRDELISYMGARTATDSASGGYEFRAVRRDGTVLWLDSIVNAIQWDGEQATLATMIDVTERKAAEEALRRTEVQLQHVQKMEAVGRLAGGVAHDFNNLLTVIIGNCDFMLEELDPQSALEKDVAQIRWSAIAATDLTRQLLAFSRQQVLEPRVMELNEVVMKAQRVLERLLGEDVELELALAPDTGRVRADAGQLEQVIMNLAVNARDAMPDGGTLLLETASITMDEDESERHFGAKPGRYALLSVRDSGVGMDAETKVRLFEPFFTTKEAGKGTGLGLATVYGIVKQSGGFISVESDPGSGAKFMIYLPQVPDAVQEQEPKPRIAPRRGTETVLLVEDSAAVRSVARLALERQGYAVLEAENGQVALAAVAAHDGPIDLLLTDLVMPGSGGRALAERLLRERNGLKVLYMSGHTADTATRKRIEEEGSAYLQKPFTPDSLVAKVREVLDA